METTDVFKRREKGAVTIRMVETWGPLHLKGPLSRCRSAKLVSSIPQRFGFGKLGRNSTYFNLVLQSNLQTWECVFGTFHRAYLSVYLLKSSLEFSALLDRNKGLRNWRYAITPRIVSCAILWTEVILLLYHKVNLHFRLFILVSGKHLCFLSETSYGRGEPLVRWLARVSSA